MKSEIKNIIIDMLSDAGINTCDTAEDFTWLFTVVKGNNEQLRIYLNSNL